MKTIKISCKKYRVNRLNKKTVFLWPAVCLHRYKLRIKEQQKQTKISLIRTREIIVQPDAKTSWRARKSKEEILRQPDSRRQINYNSRSKRCSKFIGHVTREGKLEHIATTGKSEGGKRPR